MSEVVDAAVVDTAPIEDVTTDVAEGAAVDAAPAYTPNYKFKYTGKSGDKWTDIESEFDEPIKALIKTKEDEDKYKQLYTKANGMDFIAEQREKARNEFKNYKENWTPIIDLAQKATNAYKAKDMDSFFEHLGVRPEEVERYVYNRLQQQELPREQQAMQEQNRMLQRQHAEMQERLNSFQQENSTKQTQQLYNEFQSELNKPNIAQLKDAFDARNGVGSFEDEVRMRGQLIYSTQNGRVANPAEVIGEIVKKYGLAATPAAPQAQSNVILRQQVPVIPVAKGGGQSPSGKEFKTLKQLEAYAEERLNRS